MGQATLNELTYNRSELVATLDVNLSSNWYVGSEVIWDGIESTIDRTQLQVGYQNIDTSQQFELSYFRERDVVFLRDRDGDGFSSFDELRAEDIDQIGLFASTDWRSNWSVTTRLQYDFSNSRSLDTGIGIEYQNCCWNAGLTWRRWLERDDIDNFVTEDIRHDSGIFLSFEWVGLGGIGQAPAEILTRQRSLEN